MKKIKMKDCRFEINEEKRTIICWINGISKMAEDFIREQNLDPGQMFWQSNSNRKMWRLMEIPDKVYGKAVCAAEDTWDEEFGKVVAYHKMMNKLMTLLFKALNRSFAVMYASLDRAVDAANRMGVKFGKKSDARQYAINRIAGKVEQNDNEA